MANRFRKDEQFPTRGAVLRAGMEYGFHLNRFEISPQLDVDFVEGEETLLVIGMVFATSF